MFFSVKRRSQWFLPCGNAAETADCRAVESAGILISQNHYTTASRKLRKDSFVPCEKRITIREDAGRTIQQKDRKKTCEKRRPRRCAPCFVAE
ncbi:hypothetical protein BHK98_12455 [Hornefia porci]|uniref:Uncharacterized protein n=1 Tax=Hornefia porci TaxID=2652292 RepID=A0A1Q9JKX9_9FIRM|nr:hypothetical protein BHK98_12455 [Hornefia porci]